MLFHGEGAKESSAGTDGERERERETERVGREGTREGERWGWVAEKERGIGGGAES